MTEPRKPPFAADLDILAKTIYGEARGEGALGREAVACTIINRWQSDKWFGAPSIALVCQKPWQFSCWNKDDPNLAKMEALTLLDATFRDCIGIALTVIANSSDARWAGRDKSRGATHYFADTIAAPKWAGGKKPCAIIGHHKFFKDVD